MNNYNNLFIDNNNEFIFHNNLFYDIDKIIVPKNIPNNELIENGYYVVPDGDSIESKFLSLTPLSKGEITNIFYYVITNKFISLDDNSPFSRDIISAFAKVACSRSDIQLYLTKSQKDILIESFLNSSAPFDNYTPSVIINDESCLEASIERSANTINYIFHYCYPDEAFIRSRRPNDAVIKRVLAIASSKDNDYVISKDTPDFLAQNFEVALVSIEKDVYSADYIAWSKLKEEERNELVKKLIDKNYILNVSTPYELRTNHDIVMNSIKQDIETIRYSEINYQKDPELLQYVALTKPDFLTKSDINDINLKYFLKPELMELAIRKKYAKVDNDIDAAIARIDKATNNTPIIYTPTVDDTTNAKELYYKRLAELFCKAFATTPKIKDFAEIIDYNAEYFWREKKASCPNTYANIFGKICIELTSDNDFDMVLNKLGFLEKMESVLGDEKYKKLIAAMKQYHLIVHTNSNYENFDSVRNEISSLSALYIAKAKENYKKQYIESIYNRITPYFTVRKDNQAIKKHIINCRKKENFKKGYLGNDPKTLTFLKTIINKYNRQVNENTLVELIDGFVVEGNSKLESIIAPAFGWNIYKNYKEACKLINRLNAKYIKYDDQEVANYHHIIKYNVETDKYYYSGYIFKEDELKKFSKYESLGKIFASIKKEIMAEIKKIEVSEEITEEDIIHWIDPKDLSFPFTDEYVEFNKDKLLASLRLAHFYNYCMIYDDDFFIEPISILDDQSYAFLTDYTIKNGLIWLFALNSQNPNIVPKPLDYESKITFDYIANIVSLAKDYDCDISQYKNVQMLSKVINSCTRFESISILGTDIILNLCRNTEYTNEDKSDIITLATGLISEMVKRNTSTVPYISGTPNNCYSYSMYDSQDNDILLAGINTHACFRIDGNDNDFLHYCALDKNGFVIKITNASGEFIARASGFRNGNSVFINQLRSIYDEFGNHYKGKYDNEREEIIATFKCACRDIISTSQNNPDEVDKIEHVFVTKSYVLDEYPVYVSDEMRKAIGNHPMDTTSEDWHNFINNTIGIVDESTKKRGFENDFGNYSIICMASIKDIDKLTPEDLKPKDVPALYTRKRNKIMVADPTDELAVSKINKICSINSYSASDNYELTVYKTGEVFCLKYFIGDNWYIAYDFYNHKIDDKGFIGGDNLAELEMNATIKVLEKEIDNIKAIEYEDEIDQEAANIVNDVNHYMKKLKKH